MLKLKGEISLYIWMNCAHIVRLASEHKNTYISASTQRVLTIFFNILGLASTHCTSSFFVLPAVASELGSKKGQNCRFLAPSVEKNDFSVYQVRLYRNNSLEPFCS
jgi:hypothetical protein